MSEEHAVDTSFLYRDESKSQLAKDLDDIETWGRCCYTQWYELKQQHLLDQIQEQQMEGI